MGLQVNKLKLCIYLTGIDNTICQRLLSIIDFQEDTITFRYLGIPMAAERLRISNYSPPSARLIDLIDIWLKKTLSFVDKVHLITLVLQDVKCFWLSIIPLMQGIINRIYSIYKFLYGLLNILQCLKMDWALRI